MLECNIERNKGFCTCTYEPCPKKGRCCECVIYHRRRGELPGCFFPAEAEKSYDRSIKYFVSLFKK